MGSPRRVLAVIAALLGLTAIPASASATAAPAPPVVEVSPGHSISDALARVADGGTVVLLPGSHRSATFGPRTWRRTVTLRPAAGAEGGVDVGELNLRGVENLTITGLRTRGLVTIAGGRAVTVSSSRPRGVLVKAGASNIDIVDNTIEGGWNGVAVHSWRGTSRPIDVRIAGNVISGQDNDNVQIGVADDVVVEDNDLLGTVANANHNDGVQFMGGEGLVVRGNRFARQDQSILLKAERSLGAGNAVVDALIAYNEIAETREFGVILVDTIRTRIVANTVRDIPKAGVLLSGDNEGASIVDNVIDRLYVERTATPPAEERGNRAA
jgi:hypothetical protein